MNKLKIVVNSNASKIGYYFMNESGIWIPISQYSNLSKSQYSNSSIKKAANKIVEELLNTYCPRGRKLEVHFVGSDDEFLIFNKSLSNVQKNGDLIKCFHDKLTILVTGKLGSGKTTLIQSVFENQNEKYSTKIDNNLIFSNMSNSSIWIETSIEDSLDNSIKDLDIVEKSGASKIIYCINSENGRIENTEIEIIKSIQKKYSKLDFLVVLTKYIDPEKARNISDDLKRECGQVKTFLTLAKEYTLSIGKSIESYGIDDLTKYIYER